MIEVKISFSTPDELVAFFTKSQALTTGTQTPGYSPTMTGIHLPEGTVFREDGVIEVPAAAEAALPEEPALKPKKAAKGKKETSSTQAESGANNLGSVETDTLIGNAPLSADPAVNQPEAEAVDAADDAADDAPVADVKFSIDDAREALKRLNDAQGIDAVRTLLTRFGASRISELSVDEYPNLISQCPGGGL